MEQKEGNLNRRDEDDVMGREREREGRWKLMFVLPKTGRAMREVA